MDLLPEVIDAEPNLEAEIEDNIDEEPEILPEIKPKEQIQIDEVFKKAQDLPPPVIKKVKQKRTMTEEGKAKLAKAREKALETRRRNALLRKEGKLKTRKQQEEESIKEEEEKRRPVINNNTYETKHITNNFTEEDIRRIASEASAKATQSALDGYEMVRKQRKEEKKKRKEEENHRTIVKNKINTALGMNRNNPNFYDHCF
tara:strand:+ start:1773 stop:2378 length:606 start_codon:yes stop_codon:yes gene_type:complete